MKNKGFTLIEIMVSIAIITIIMSVVLFSYGNFEDSLALSSAAQEISVAIRQAQVYGISVKESSVGSGTCSDGSTSAFCLAYGIYFSTAYPTSYNIFVDLNKDYMYNFDGCAVGGECVEKDYLQNGVKITAVCGKAFGSNTSMTCPSDTGNVASMHVIFTRPNPNAGIRFSDASNNSLTGVYQTGRITLTSAKGKTANIDVSSTGQILIN